MPAKSPLNQINADGLYVTDQDDRSILLFQSRKEKKIVLSDKNTSLPAYSNLHLAQDCPNQAGWVGLERTNHHRWLIPVTTATLGEKKTPKLGLSSLGGRKIWVLSLPGL